MGFASQLLLEMSVITDESPSIRTMKFYFCDGVLSTLKLLLHTKNSRNFHLAKWGAGQQFFHRKVVYNYNNTCLM